MTVDPGWFAVAIAALGLLQLASLAQQRNGREDRKEIVGKLDNLRDLVAKQNGRVGLIEAWRDGHEKWAGEQTRRFDETDRALSRRLDDSWNGPERRRHPRKGMTEE